MQLIASTGTARVEMSVCLSVRLVYCIKTNAASVVISVQRAFNKVVRWRKSGEVEGEFTSRNFFGLFVIFVPKIFTVGGNLTKFWSSSDENNSAQFLRHAV